ncbi:MAG: VWA domain-containing protein, partial [Chloroflexota bacterium]
IIGSPMVDGDGNWSFPFTLEGPAGDYSVRGLMFNNEDRDVLLDTELADSISVPVVGTITLGPVENDGNGNLTTSGVTVPGRDVNIWVNGEIVDTVTADADGNWSWMTPTPVGAGEYTVQAQLAEFPDIVSDALSVRVLPFVSLNAPDITLNDDNTGDVTISGRTLPSNRVEIFVDGQYLGETAADADGNWTFIANLSAGAYTIAARAVDVSGSRRAEAALRAVVGEAIGGLELVYAGTSEVGEGSDEVQTVSISGVPVVEIILDASWSMVEPIDNTTRFDIAKEALNNIAGEVLPEGTPTALRIFGNIEGDFACRSDLMVPYGPLDRDVFNRVVAEAEPQFNANTAIGASLLEVVNDLADATEEERIVVLLTDGQETCDGDPAGAIQQLVDAGFNVQVNIVGLAIADQTLKDEFTRWATIGGGQYYDVSNPGQLIDAMRAASGAFYSVRDENGDLVASSRVGGPTLDLTPGTYTVEIRTSPTTVIEEVEIAEGEVLQIVLR